MSSFVSFSQFIRQGGQASVTLSLRPAGPTLELKRAPLALVSVGAFEKHLRDLAAENWARMTAAFARVGIETDPGTEDTEADVA